MIKKTTIETQLDCRATAELRSEIADDLNKPDKSLSEVLSKQKEQEDKDESQDISSSSD